MPERIAKINELIKRHVSELLSRELSLKPGIFLTVSKVDTSRDLRYTKIFISVFPHKESEYAIKTLEKEIYSIQGQKIITATQKQINIENLVSGLYIIKIIDATNSVITKEFTKR